MSKILYPFWEFSSSSSAAVLLLPVISLVNQIVLANWPDSKGDYCYFHKCRRGSECAKNNNNIYNWMKKSSVGTTDNNFEGKINVINLLKIIWLI